MQGGQTGKPLKGYLKSSRSVPLMQATAILRERRCTPRSLTLLQSLTQTHPRIPRGGQSGREKRRDKSLPWVSEDDPNLLSQRRSRRANFSPPTPPPQKKVLATPNHFNARYSNLNFKLYKEKMISSREMVANKGQNQTEIVIELSRNILKNYRFLYMYSLAPDISYQQSVASSSNGIL